MYSNKGQVCNNNIVGVYINTNLRIISFESCNLCAVINKLIIQKVFEYMCVLMY